SPKGEPEVQDRRALIGADGAVERTADGADGTVGPRPAILHFLSRRNSHIRPKGGPEVHDRHSLIGVDSAVDVIGDGVGGGAGGAVRVAACWCGGVVDCVGGVRGVVE
uniref:hypothetical protein n=1 Tax=Micromonospora gifhornensis TaxID=84594 RepID=UPI003D73C91A